LLKAFFSSQNVNHFGTKYALDSNTSYISYVNKNNYNLAFISCTYGNNTNIENSQVLLCYDNGKPNQLLLELVKTAKKSSDAVIVTPHWGNEYSPSPSSQQKSLARALVNSGAKAIIGHHPHVIQPLEYIQSSDGYKVPVLYSLGNFVSNQAPSNWKDPKKNESRFKRRVGATAFLGFSNLNGELQIDQVDLMPTYMKIVHEGKKGMRTLLPAYEAFANGATLKKSLVKAQKHFLNSIDKKHMFSDADIKKGLVCQ